MMQTVPIFSIRTTTDWAWPPPDLHARHDGYVHLPPPPTTLRAGEGWYAIREGDGPGVFLDWYVAWMPIYACSSPSHRGVASKKTQRVSGAVHKRMPTYQDVLCFRWALGRCTHDPNLASPSLLTYQLSKCTVAAPIQILTTLLCHVVQDAEARQEEDGGPSSEPNVHDWEDPNSPLVDMKDADEEEGVVVELLTPKKEPKTEAPKATPSTVKTVVNTPKSTPAKPSKASVVAPNRSSLSVVPTSTPGSSLSQSPVTTQSSAATETVPDLATMLADLSLEQRGSFPPLGKNALEYVTSHPFGIEVFEVLTIYEHAKGDVNRIKNILAAKLIPLRSILFFVSMVKLDRSLPRAA